MESLVKLRKLELTKWTRELRSYKQLLDNKRKQLKANLAKNSRKRYFIISNSTVDDFDELIVSFICNYLDKYHFKILHDETPLFCLHCQEELFSNVIDRLYKKGIKINHGFYFANYFNSEHFFRKPIVKQGKKKDEREVEFDIRIIRYDKNVIQLLNERKCDDLFIISDDEYEDLDYQDVNVEVISLTRFAEIEYVLGERDSYD